MNKKQKELTEQLAKLTEWTGLVSVGSADTPELITRNGRIIARILEKIGLIISDHANTGGTVELVNAKPDDGPDFMGYFADLEVGIYYDYQPEEDRTTTYPGCAASIDVGCVMFRNTDITEAVRESTLDWLSIEEQCWEHVYDGRHDDGGKADYLYEQARDRKLEEKA